MTEVAAVTTCLRKFNRKSSKGSHDISVLTMTNFLVFAPFLHTSHDNPRRNFLTFFLHKLHLGVALGAIGAHAIVKRSDEMKETWRVSTFLSIAHFFPLKCYSMLLVFRLDPYIIWCMPVLLASSAYHLFRQRRRLSLGHFSCLELSYFPALCTPSP